MTTWVSKIIHTLDHVRAFEKKSNDFPLDYWLKIYLDIPTLLRWGKLPRGLSILEVGCGTGKYSRTISKKTHCKNYTAIDVDAQTISRAESKNAEDSKIIFQRADVLRLPFNKSSFDVVIILDTLHHVADWRRAIREIKRVLKPKGKFLFRDYSIDTYSMPLLGIITRQIVDRPFDHMFDQIEFTTYLSKSGFHITHQNDSSWFMLMAAEKTSR